MDADSSEPSSRRILTIPNLLSFLRLGSVPVFLWLWLSDRRPAAVILYAAGALTDFFDGYIARRTNSVSELGKLLDPLADRVFIIALAVALVAAGIVPLWVTAVIVARDVLILAAFPLVEKRGIPRIPVSFVGKTATAALLTGLTLLAFSGAWDGWIDTVRIPGLTLMVLGAVLYWVAAGLYAREAAQGWRSAKQGGAA